MFGDPCCEQHNRDMEVPAVMLILILGWAGAEGSSRQKRLIWITNDGRLALPPGTLLTITPTISMPFVRYPPDGFLSNMTISLPFTINFDTLGLTDNQNPYGVLPPILARSMGRSAGALFADYVASFINNRRKTRSSAEEMMPSISNLFHGGERALLYIMIEDFLANFGLNGRACLLRAACEVHSHTMKRFGFFGEIIKLFFTASKSPYADVIKEYVEAEKRGSEGGECFPYFKECPKSLFLPPEENKYMVREKEDGKKNMHVADDHLMHMVDEVDSPEVTLNNEILENKIM